MNEFDARRFLNERGEFVASPLFRGFGGGPSLCPGRHFAIAQIVVLVAVMVLRYDMRWTGEGKGKRPVVDETKMFDIVSPPVGDVEVELEVREEWKDCEWEICVE